MTETEDGTINETNEDDTNVEIKLSSTRAWRKYIGYLLKFIVTITNLQPLANLRIYLDIFDITSLVALLIYNVIVFFFLCGNTCISKAFSGDIDELANQLGDLTQYNFMLILFPVAKRTIILPYFGVPTHRMMMFHKWLGRWIFVLLIIHGTLFAIYYYQQGSWSRLWDEFTTKDIVMGELTGLAIFIVVLTSLKIVRRSLYEVFIKSHYIASILALIWACHHVAGDQMIKLCSYSIAIYGLDVFIRLIKLSCSRYPVKYKLISPKYVELTVEGRVKYQAGEYVYLWIPTISPIEMHPFSISSIPESGGMTVIVKVDGNWSRRLADRPVERVWIEGSYSAATIPTSFYSRLIFVAGGTGITPFISIVNSIRERNRKPENRTQVDLFWSSSCLDLFGYFEQNIVHLLEDECIHIHLYYTGKEDVQAVLGDQCSRDFKDSINVCRIDIPQQLGAYAVQIPNFSNIGVLSCGPASLVNESLFCPT